MAKGKTKVELAHDRELRNAKRRIKYAEKKGYEFKGKLPKTTEGLHNLRGEKLLKQAVKIEDNEPPQYPKEPPESERSKKPVEDLREAKAYLQNLLDYISGKDSPNDSKFMTEKNDEIKGKLQDLISAAINHYGFKEFITWLFKKGGEKLYKLIEEVFDSKQYRNYGPKMAEIASYLNRGPLTQDQSEQFTMYGNFDFSEDELDE